MSMDEIVSLVEWKPDPNKIRCPACGGGGGSPMDSVTFGVRHDGTNFREMRRTPCYKCDGTGWLKVCPTCNGCGVVKS